MRSPMMIGAAAFAALAAGIAGWSAWGDTPEAAAPNQTGVVQTQWGPLDDADRDLIVRVRLAGLWEHPVGHDMAERATQPKAKDVGEKISTEHQKLNEITDDTAKKLGVALPSQPTPDQSGWMKQVADAKGPDVAILAVNLMRKSHGSILPQIEKVRVATRNSVVRDFANTAAEYVARHIGYLESTGLVDYEKLPRATPTKPGHAVVTKAGTYEISPDGLSGIGIFVIVAILGGLVAFSWSASRSQPESRVWRDTGEPERLPGRWSDGRTDGSPRSDFNDRQGPPNARY